jgi:hypothetical protein
MARLTNDMRETFVNAVLADVHDNGLEEALHKAARAAYMTLVPDIINIIHTGTDDTAKGFINTCGVTFIATQDQEREWPYYCTSVGLIPYSPDLRHANRHYLCENFPEVQIAWAKWCEFYMAKEQLKIKLETIAAACSSTKKLLDALPELAQYMPSEPVAGTSNLPASNEVAVLLGQLGWKEKAEA